MKDPRSDHTMKWTRAKLVPFTNEDGSVSTYDVVTNTIVLEHIIGPHQGKRLQACGQPRGQHERRDHSAPKTMSGPVRPKASRYRRNSAR